MNQNKEVMKYEEMQKTFEKNREVYSIEDLRDICSSTLSSLIHQINGSTTGFNLLVEIFQENEKKKLTNVEYNRKVKIPKFVASWIKDENIKANGFDGILNDAIFSYQFHYIGDESIKDWILRNPMKLKKALDYGYQVEEEPKYEVIINGKWLINMFSDRIAIRFVEKDELPNWGSAAYKLTEKEIKDIDKRYWPFAEPVEKEVSE